MLTLPQNKLWSDEPADFPSSTWDEMRRAWLGQALPLHVKAHQPTTGQWGTVHVRTGELAFRFCETGVGSTHEMTGVVGSTDASSFESAMSQLVEVVWELLLWGVRQSWRPIEWVETLPAEVEPIARRVLPELFEGQR